MMNICCLDEEKLIITQIFQESNQEGYRLYLDASTIHLLSIKKERNELSFLLEGNVFFLGEKLADLFHVDPIFDYAQAKISFSIENYLIQITSISLSVSQWSNRYIPLFQYLQNARFTFDSFALAVNENFQLELYDPFNGYREFKKGIIKKQRDFLLTINDVLYLVEKSIKYKLTISEEIKKEIKLQKDTFEFIQHRDMDLMIRILEDNQVVKKIKLISQLNVLENVFPAIQVSKLSQPIFDYTANDYRNKKKNYRLWMVNLFIIYIHAGQRLYLFDEWKNLLKEMNELQWFTHYYKRLKALQFHQELSYFQLHTLLFGTSIEGEVLVNALLVKKKERYVEVITDIRFRTDSVVKKGE